MRSWDGLRVLLAGVKREEDQPRILGGRSLGQCVLCIVDRRAGFPLLSPGLVKVVQSSMEVNE